VVFRAYNDSNPDGVRATLTVHVSGLVHYVAADSGSPVAQYSSWATAATNIQDAVDAAAVGALVLVSNGVYQTGGRAVYGTTTNRVVVDKPMTVRSVNGPEVTVIRGYQVPGATNGDGAVRCAYLTNGALISGFTVTNGATQRYESGGGVWCESVSALVSNCVLTGNSAYFAGGGAYQGTLNNCTLTGNSAYNPGTAEGGGAYGGTLNNCTLTGNSARGGANGGYGGGAIGSTLNNCILTGNRAAPGSRNLGGGGGGGAYGGTLNNCTLSGNSAGYGGGASWGTLNNCALTGNSAEYGGGAVGGTLNNCIVYLNTAPNGANYNQQSGGILNYCCTTPLPTNGEGNFTNAPLFVNQAGGDLRLQASSSCINSGLNAYAPAGLDVDGHPRIAGGTVDVGAYEFQSPQSAISYAWLQGYGLPSDGSVDFTDADGDGLNNWQEWRCLTDPTNALSVLRLLTPASGAPGVMVRWQSVSGRTYFLERSTTLGASPAFGRLASNIIGQTGTTAYADTNAVGAGPFFYRVGVEE
jgi:hypothetical protein